MNNLETNTPMKSMSPCCHAETKNYLNTKFYKSLQCSSCKSLWVEHFQTPSNGSWDEENITEEFIDALVLRRRIQAENIYNKLQSTFHAGPLLDYSCGTGSFVEFMRKKDVEAYGCDLYLPALTENVKQWVSPLKTGWSLPEDLLKEHKFHTMTLLDVIEHMDEPGVFLKNVLEKTSIKSIVIKTPDFSGPLAKMARSLGALGKTSVMDSLLLAGDQSPHLSYLTKQGLQKLAEQQGWSLKVDWNLAEVGPEIADRIRGEAAKFTLPRPIVKSGGQFLESISPFWGDTFVMVFER